MAKPDLQPLCDRIFELAALDIDIDDCGHRRSITWVDSRLQLQRRRVDHEQWAAVIRVKPAHLELVEQWVHVAQLIDRDVEWRVTAADGTPIDPASSADVQTTTEKANDPAT